MTAKWLQKTTLLAFALAWTLGCREAPYREVAIDLSAKASRPTIDARDDRKSVFRFSVAAMQSPDTTHSAYSRLFSRVGTLLGSEMEFVQRRTYNEVNDLLLGGQVDAALICTGGYLELQRRVSEEIEILAVPVIGGETTYHSLILVPASSSAKRFEDLRGKRFAYTDQLSLSGRAYAIHLVRKMGEDPAAFFPDAQFTYSHDRSIDAVTRGLVDAASVDSLIYDTAVRQNADIASGTRVLLSSPPLGMMPVVAAPRLSIDMRKRLRDVLLSIDRDPEAAEALRTTGIQRFVVPAPGLYESAASIVESDR